MCLRHKNLIHFLKSYWKPWVFFTTFLARIIHWCSRINAFPPYRPRLVMCEWGRTPRIGCHSSCTLLQYFLCYVWHFLFDDSCYISFLIIYSRSKCTLLHAMHFIVSINSSLACVFLYKKNKENSEIWKFQKEYCFFRSIQTCLAIVQ